MNTEERILMLLLIPIIANSFSVRKYFTLSSLIPNFLLLRSSFVSKSILLGLFQKIKGLFYFFIAVSSVVRCIATEQSLISQLSTLNLNENSSSLQLYHSSDFSTGSPEKLPRTYKYNKKEPLPEFLITLSKELALPLKILISLELSQSNLTDADLKVFAKIDILHPFLKVLILSDNNISGEGLKSLENFPSIEELNLNKNNLTSSIFPILASCKFANTIKILELGWNSLFENTKNKDKGKKNVLSIKNFRSLENLSLFHCNVGDENSESIIQALKTLSQFKSLNIGSNILTDGIISSLNDFSVEHLYLRHNNFTSQGIKEFVKISCNKLETLDIAANSSLWGDLNHKISKLLKELVKAKNQPNLKKLILYCSTKPIPDKLPQKLNHSKKEDLLICLSSSIN